MGTLLLRLSVDDLPKNFTYEIVCSDEEMTVIRSNLMSMKDINQWVYDFGELTNTRWISRNSDPKGERFVCWKKFVCYRTPYKKRESIKSPDCDATLYIKVKRNIPDVIIEDPYVQLGLPAEIRIKNQHTHDVIGDVIQYRRNRMNQDVKYKFFEYFDAGLGVRESWRHHQRMLLGDYAIEELSDCEIFPTERAVRYWRELWRQINFKPGQTSYQPRYEHHLIKENLKAAHTRESELISDDDIPDANTQNESIEGIIDLLRTYDAKYGSSATGLKILKCRLHTVKGRDGWETFLRSAGNSFMPQLRKEVESRMGATSLSVNISHNRKNKEKTIKGATFLSRFDISHDGTDDEEKESDIDSSSLPRFDILHSKSNGQEDESYMNLPTFSRITIPHSSRKEKGTHRDSIPFSRMNTSHNSSEDEESHMESILFSRINNPHNRRLGEEPHRNTTSLSRMKILDTIEQEEEETDMDPSFLSGIGISSNINMEGETCADGSTSSLRVKKVMKARKTFPSKRPVIEQNKSMKVRILTNAESINPISRNRERAYVIKVMNC